MLSLKSINLTKKFFKIGKRMMTDVLQSTQSTSLHGLKPEEYEAALKTGADLTLTGEKKELVLGAGFKFSDTNGLNIKEIPQKKKQGDFQYLKNMCLFQDYDEAFRTFFQAIAIDSYEGLDLVTEPRLRNFFIKTTREIRKNGLRIEMEDIKNLQDYSVLRVELFKNLKMDRTQNEEYSKYGFSNYPFPLFKKVVSATKFGSDLGYFQNERPFILATTCLVKTPMKIQVHNQNLSKVLHGDNAGELQEYIVRFESELNFNDLFWILPTQNKPKRLRHTKIADFNNVLRGNPFFTEKFDLYSGNSKDERFAYMEKDEEKDKKVTELIKIIDKIQFRSYKNTI